MKKTGLFLIGIGLFCSAYAIGGNLSTGTTNGTGVGNVSNPNNNNSNMNKGSNPSKTAPTPWKNSNVNTPPSDPTENNSLGNAGNTQDVGTDHGGGNGPPH
jgi:hypothetical protein